MINQDDRNEQEESFWNDDLLVCKVCGGCICHTCSCPGGPRGPKLHPGLNDEPHGDNIKSD